MDMQGSGTKKAGLKKEAMRVVELALLLFCKNIRKRLQRLLT